MKNFVKTNKGITLIALVITIIVLLILAGVALNLTIGQNGIFTRAQDAANTWKNAEANEQSALNDLSSWMDQYLNGNGGEEDNQGAIKVSFKIEGEKVTEPPIPSDFTHVDGTEINSGYVIQDEDGNQFVWVPVDKNQKIKINVTSEANIDSISLTDPYGDDIPLEDTDNLGTTYNNENVETRINGPYRLTVTAGGESKNVFLSVHSLYAIDTFTDWIDIEGIVDEQLKEIEQKASNQGYSSTEEFFNAMMQAEGQPTLEEMRFSTVRDYLFSIMIVDSSMKDYSETENYKQSVNDNGGFYIARYEASYQDGKAASKASTSTNYSGNTNKLANGMLWNYISQTKALTKANEMYAGEGFTSSLPTGAAWDRTLAWLEETGAVSKAEILVDSKTWGNYTDDTFTNTKGLINTGEYSETEKNHISDLAGNLWEWTTEAYSANYRVGRRWSLLRFRLWRFSFRSLRH